MIKHVAKHNQRKAVLLYREVPGEDHMCLIAYSDKLPQMVHDEVMKTLESPVGQQAKDFADALFRNIMPDGRNTLEVLHLEGWIQKVPCNQVIISANQSSTIRLDELNGILNEMSKGAEATQRLAELDAGAGSTGKQKPRRGQVKEGRELGAPPEAVSRSVPAVITESSVLSDADLAAQRLTQAEQMKKQAQSLIAEADRLAAEAAALNPELKVNAKKTKVKAH